MVKKLLGYLFIACFFVGVFTGCSSNRDINDNGNSTENNNIEDKISVVCTIFPQYDWVRQILGEHEDRFDLTLLLNNGVDLHNYQPTVDDMVKVSNCDLFIYVGGESDAWVEEMLKNVSNPEMRVVNLLEVLGNEVKEEEIKEGMEHSHSHGGDIHFADIEDRTLSGFSGAYRSMHVDLADGSLDRYIQQEAQEHGVHFAEMKQTLIERRTAAFDSILISGDRVSVTSENGSGEGEYDYVGFYTVENEGDEITGVWYVYQMVSSGETMPKYLAFNDHNISESTEHAEPVRHFHLRYGDDSVESLMEENNWSPMFFDAAAAGEEILDSLLNHDHSHEEEDHLQEHDETELDEHVWLSLRLAQALCSHLANEIILLDRANGEAYEKNLFEYTEKLALLDEEYRNVVENAYYDTVLFADRFPFRYLVDDYGLDYYAAFSGCSAETEASFQTIAFLAEKLNELILSSVFVIETSDQSIAKTVINNGAAKDQAICVLDSLQSVTYNDIQNGKTYISAMQDNLTALAAGLNR